jgi:prevent-host-death family protein
MLDKSIKSRDTWQFQEAKAKLSQVMDAVQEKGLQVIVRNRNEEYIIITKEKYDEVTCPKDSLLKFFSKAPYPELDLDIERSKDFPRDIEL